MAFNINYMKKVLVTGAAGFIGSNMVKFLLENTDYYIYGIDNFQNGRSNENFIKNIENNYKLRFKFIEKNINEIEIGDMNIEIVYHFAATPRVSFSVEDPLGTNENNVTNTLIFLDICRRANVNRFVFSSSSSVYGDINSFPTKEDYKKTPKSPYALQKSIIEDYCRLWSELYGIDTVCLRYFNVYGPNQYAENAYATVICAWVLGYIKNQNIRLDGEGNQSRDFTYVTDICNANYIVGESKENFNGKCFNAAGGNNYSLLKVKDIIEGLSDNRPLVEKSPNRAGDVLKTHSDSSELGKLGFKTKVELEKGIKETYEWYKKNI